MNNFTEVFGVRRDNSPEKEADMATFWVFCVLLTFIAVCIVGLLIAIVYLSVKLCQLSPRKSGRRTVQHKWTTSKDSPYQWGNMTYSFNNEPWLMGQFRPIFKPVAQSIMHKLEARKMRRSKVPPVALV